MGHRRHSQPRRGSLAYLPRGRAKSMEARIRAWPNPTLEEPHMLAHVGFKAGCIQVVSIDDREKTPNHGKQLVSLGTVLVTPPVTIIGLRGYTKDMYGTHATFDIYAKDMPKSIAKHITLKNKEDITESSKQRLGNIDSIFAIVAISPRDAGLEQKKPYIFETPVTRRYCKTGGVTKTVPKLTSCFPWFGVFSLSSILTTWMQPALNPTCANMWGSSNVGFGHALMRASMLLARPLGRYARLPLRG